MSTGEAKAGKGPRRLINHRDVARRFGVSTRTWRRWYETGEVPLPHQVIGTMLLYDRAAIEHRLATGEWPAGSRFRGDVAADSAAPE